MRIRRKIYSWFAALALLTSCATDAELPESNPVRGVSVTCCVNTRAYDAKGQLITYPDDKLSGTQHASTVYVLVFNGSGDDADFTGSVTNIGWKEHFQDALPDKTAQMAYHVNYEFQSGMQYTLLGIGLTEGADLLFNLPSGITKGTTLSQLKGALTDAARCHEIQSSEIYVGTIDFIAKDGKDEIDVLNLYRRVAGVMGYFTDIPTKVRYKEVDTPVHELRISLYDKQNIELPLLKRRQKPYFEDFIQSPASTVADGEVIFRIPVPDPCPKSTVLNGGSYVLPMNRPTSASQSTMLIELVNKQEGRSDLVLKTYKVKLPQDDPLDHGSTGGGTGIIDMESAFHYPIIANHFYAIGKPGAPVDLGGNENVVEIFINPAWSEDNDLNVTE